MNLADMLKTDWFGQVATATLATSVTHGPEALRSVATVATVTVAIPENQSAANDPACPKASEPQIEPTVNTSLDTADSKTLDVAYQAHYFKCTTCIASGLGRGPRCGVGSELWTLYCQAVQPNLNMRDRHEISPTSSDPSPESPPRPQITDEENIINTARLTLFDARGLNADDTERLAEKLLVRDRELGRWGACAECSHLTGTRPGRWRCSDRSHVRINELAGAWLAAVFVHQQLHNCCGRRNMERK